MKNKIKAYIEAHRQEILNELCTLVRIPSVRGTATDERPYGEECARVLEHIEGLYRKNGIETELDIKGGYLLSYIGEGAKSLGLFAHADVVAVDDKWTLCKPFEPKEINGFLVGRGTSDDKPAVIIALYCAKMIKELGIPFNSRLICFAGANEESGMMDIQNYAKKHKAPDFSLVNDSGFPLGIGNKGMLWLNATTDYEFEDIEDAFGGESINIILGSVRLTLRYSPELLCELENDKSVEVCVDNGRIILDAKGISSHGAMPEGSHNAFLVASDALCRCKSFSASDKKRLEFIKALLSGYYGQALGIESNDAPFGKLTFTNGRIRMSDKRLALSFDTRFGCELEPLKTKMLSAFEKNGMSVEIIKSASAHLVSENEPHVQACLDAYKDYTGEREAKPFVGAGSTYIRFLPCACEMGCSLGGGWLDLVPQGHGSCHQPDEFISIDGFFRALELTMHMLLSCDEKNK